MSEKEKVFKELLDEEHKEEATSKLGINRGQFFVRIPRVISNRLDLKETDSIKFTITRKNDKDQLTVEIVSNES